MSDPAEIPPLRHDELVYRRLSREYFDASQRVVKVLAFRPTKADSDGLSLSRQVAGAEGAAASGREGKAFYVAVLRVSDIIDQLGLHVIADRADHALIPELTFAARESKDQAVRDRIIDASDKLTSIIVEVVGPFPGRAQPPTPQSPV